MVILVTRPDDKNVRQILTDQPTDQPTKTIVSVDQIDSPKTTAYGRLEPLTYVITLTIRLHCTEVTTTITDP